MSDLDLFRQKLLDAEKEAEDALVARDQAQDRLDTANKTRAAWRVIVSNATVPDLPTPSNIVTSEPKTIIVPIYSGNKTEWVRGMISGNENTGITPAEIRNSAGLSGIELSPQFPYTILYKLKEGGRVREERGRYFMNP